LTAGRAPGADIALARGRSLQALRSRPARSRGPGESFVSKVIEILAILKAWELHPALVHFPIAFGIAAVALDLWARRNTSFRLFETATNLMWATVGTGGLAAIFGLVAYFTVPAHTPDAHLGMLWHLFLNAIAMLLFTWAAFWRTRLLPAPPTPGARTCGLTAVAFMVLGGFLGGDIVYHGGAGVDPNILAPEVRTHTHVDGAEASGHVHEHEHGGHEHVHE
jgi:uncharacterized membrane protein